MRGQTGLPLWAAGVLAGLFVPVVVPFELVFGDGVGALAAGGGVVIGLLIAVAATRWRCAQPRSRGCCRPRRRCNCS